MNNAVGLRKRTGRDRSIEPRGRNNKVSVAPVRYAGWEKFKEVVCTAFPEVSFPDEYIDDKLVTASVVGVSDVSAFVKLVGDKVKLNTQDGRVVVEYELKDGTKRSNHKAHLHVVNMIMNPVFWEWILWGIFFLFTARFVISNREKYMKLL